MGGVRIAVSELVGAVASPTRATQSTERLDRDHLALLHECAVGKAPLMLAGEYQRLPGIASQ
jgi:hypothetical protein